MWFDHIVGHDAVEKKDTQVVLVSLAWNPDVISGFWHSAVVKTAFPVFPTITNLRRKPPNIPLIVRVDK